MKAQTLYKISKIIFTIFMIFSAVGELTFNETVVQSMETLQMPVYWLYLLGSAKVLGLLAIWFSPYKWLKEWAYAGFMIDFTGAIFGFVMVNQLIMPDIIMAPLALIICQITYWLYTTTRAIPAA